MRPRCPDNIHDLMKGVAFDIEFDRWSGSEHFRQVQNVTAANMALVRTRMDGYPVGTSIQRNGGKSHDIRDADGAGITQQGDLVDVDAQFCHQ